MWSAEKRAEGLEYMHPKPSSHSGRIVGHAEVAGSEATTGVKFRADLLSH